MTKIYALLALLLFYSCETEKGKKIRTDGEARCPVYATITTEYSGTIELRRYSIKGHAFIGRLNGANTDLLVHDPDCFCLSRKSEPCK